MISAIIHLATSDSLDNATWLKSLDQPYIAIEDRLLPVIKKYKGDGEETYKIIAQIASKEPVSVRDYYIFCGALTWFLTDSYSLRPRLTLEESLRKVEEKYVRKEMSARIVRQIIYSRALLGKGSTSPNSSYRALKMFDDDSIVWSCSRTLRRSFSLVDRKKSVSLVLELIKKHPAKKSYHLDAGASYWGLAQLTKAKTDYQAAVKHMELGEPAVPDHLKKVYLATLNNRRKVVNRM